MADGRSSFYKVSCFHLGSTCSLLVRQMYVTLRFEGAVYPFAPCECQQVMKLPPCSRLTLYGY
ncbi:hypothetical protein COMA2_240018 [Candidatus Nitrospira nitrificans]|uniref:Uncharacterized protein n=1 Tax=Candidatus Nitrospira nitrificans TaxID=1742973 RepID=A0A0S4LG99_9BACT|nr:hypothetical protein COMA2_240018 [Candidatus Nitrospira nitrificans]